MALSQVQKLKIKNTIIRMLHAPGGPYWNDGGRSNGVNRQAGSQGQTSISKRQTPTLEMTLIFDCAMDTETAKSKGSELSAILKTTDEIFRNVRVNAVQWKSDEDICQEVTALPMLLMGRYFDSYEHKKSEKRLEVLMGYLKRFHARSRLLLLLTEGEYQIADETQLLANIKPFLYRKLLILNKDEIQEFRGGIL